MHLVFWRISGVSPAQENAVIGTIDGANGVQSIVQAAFADDGSYYVTVRFNAFTNDIDHYAERRRREFELTLRSKFVSPQLTITNTQPPRAG